MDKSFQRKESDIDQQKSVFLTSLLQTFGSILALMRHFINWLAGLIKLTKEEKENAGVYLGDFGDE